MESYLQEPFFYCSTYVSESDASLLDSDPLLGPHVFPDGTRLQNNITN